MSAAERINFMSSRELLNALAANAAILAPDGKITTVNIRWADFADQNGLRMPRFGIGANYYEVCESAQGEDRNFSLEAVRALRELAQGGREAVWIRYPCHSPTKQRWFLLNATRIASRKPAPVLVLHEDITKLVMNHERLNKIDLELARLALSIPREIRDPLHTIENHLDLIRRDLGAVLQHSTSQYFDVVAGTAKRLSALVTEALNLAVLSEGQHVALEDVDMDEIARQAIENLAELVRDHHVTIDVHHLGRAVGNRAYLVGLYQNLISNAILHSGPAARVQLGIVWRDAERLFFVRDSGPGVPPELGLEIFEPFRHSTDSVEGSGLGLAMCRHIVEHHNGLIFVESQLGQGSTFYFSLSAGL
jgi:signal transduction histidine kinase